MSGACSAQGRQAGVGLGPPTGPAQRARVAGLPAGCRHPRVPVLAPGGRAAGGRRHRGHPDRPGPDHHRPRPHLLAAFDAQITGADQRLAACCRGPGSRCCAAALAGGWSALPPMAPRSATRHGGPAPARWTEPAGCAPPPMPRPAAAMTAPSAGKARSPCGGPCAGSGRAAGPGRPRRCRLPAGPSQATRGDRQRHGESGQPHRLGHGQRPTTRRPTRWSCASPPAPDPGCQAGWLGAGSDTAGDVADHRSRRGTLGARPPVTHQHPDQVG